MDRRLGKDLIMEALILLGYIIFLLVWLLVAYSARMRVLFILRNKVAIVAALKELGHVCSNNGRH